MADTIAIDSPPISNAVLAMQPALIQNKVIRGGREQILLNKNTYINRLDQQSDEQFKAMVEMAPFYILYPKVVDGFTGTIFSKPPSLKGLKELNEKEKLLNSNVDMLGNSFDKVSETVINQILENGFCATMNDYSNEAKRPFIRLIKPDQFVSFKVDTITGYPKITQFIYKEEVQTDNPENEFDSVIVNQYTVLDISSVGTEQRYRVRIYNGLEASSNAATTEKMVLISESFPTKDGKYFTSIPIKIHGAESNNFTVNKSIMQDISDMNISVFQRVIDQTYMLHWTALPTPWVTGVDSADAPDTIGPSKILSISNPEANIGMLEFTGSSAKAHQDFIDNLLHIMSVMGAQILKKEGVSRETATSVLVRTASQTSLVATVVNNASGQLQETLGIYYDWAGIKVDSEFSYKLNDDFLKVDMEPNAQIALVKSWLDGAISHKTLFNKMKEGEIVQPNQTFDQELLDIKENPPPFLLEQLQAKLQEASDKRNEDKKRRKDDKGSNLQNGNINNPLGTENA